jgi:hypothetical protein
MKLQFQDKGINWKELIKFSGTIDAEDVKYFR